MMARLALLILAGLSANAALITNDVSYVTGTGAVSQVIAQPDARDFPTVIDGVTYLAAPSISLMTNGHLSLGLVAGRYSLTFVGRNTTMQIVVPPGDGTYTLAQVATNLNTFSYTNALAPISGLVLPGTNVVFQTNHAGLPSETVTISATAGGSAAAIISSQVPVNLPWSFTPTNRAVVEINYWMEATTDPQTISIARGAAPTMSIGTGTEYYRAGIATVHLEADEEITVSGEGGAAGSYHVESISVRQFP